MKVLTNTINNNKIKLFALCTFLFMVLLTTTKMHAQYDINVTTIVRQPVSPYLMNLSNNQGNLSMTSVTNDLVDNLSVILRNTGNQQRAVKLHIKIERIAPYPMSISVRDSYQPQNPILLQPNQTLQLTPDIIEEAFGYFSKNNLLFENISLAELRSNAVNYKLPEGQYRFCVTAYDFNQPGQSMPLSAPGTGCANFRICYSASAPQFIMPVSSMQSFDLDFKEITPTSNQIQFSWTPPTTTCGLPMGALNYNLEIREIYPGQNITDGTHNPPVFEKQKIPTTNFLLDTLRFPNVLRKNQKYIVRVQADFMQQMNNPISIDNNGYSELIGFIYQPETNISVSQTQDEVEPEQEETDLTDKIIKGRLSWAFRKSEENHEPPSLSSYTPINSAPEIAAGDLQVTPVGQYMGATPFNQNNYNALVTTDPTLDLHSGFEAANAVPLNTNFPHINESSWEVTASSSTANSISYESDVASSETGRNKHPLQGAMIQLKMAKSAISNNTSVSNNANNHREMTRSQNQPISALGGRTLNTWGAFVSDKVIVDTDASNQLNGIQVSQNTDLINALINTESTTEAGSKWQVIATAETSADGSFVLEYVNEEFLENIESQELLLTVNHPGFYNFSKIIKAHEFSESSQEIDLGELTLVANTFRFSPSVKDILKEASSFPIEEVKIDIYRESALFSTHDFLNHEGNINTNSRETKSFIGKQFSKIATATISDNSDDWKTFNFNRLFAFDRFYIQISSENAGLKTLTADLRVQTPDELKTKIAHIYAEYEQTFNRPSIEGQVVVDLDGHEVSVQDALIKISYQKADVEGLTYEEEQALLDNVSDLINNDDHTISHPGQNLDGTYTIENPYSHTTQFSYNGITLPSVVTSTTTTTTQDFVVGFNSEALMTNENGSTLTEYDESHLNDRLESMLMGSKIVSTDESGYFYADNLPQLKEGAKFIVTLESVPNAYKDMPVEPQGKTMEVLVNLGETPFKKFKLKPEIIPIVGKVLDENGNALSFAKLSFENSDAYFETNNSGVFQTTHFSGTHTLIVEKSGYVKKEGTLVIEEGEARLSPPLVPEETTVNGVSLGDDIGGSAQISYNTYSDILIGTVSGSNLQTADIESPFVPFEPPALVFEDSSDDESYTQTISSLIDVGDIGYLERKKSKIQFVVKDLETDEPIENVEIAVFDTIHKTNAEGKWYYEGYGGQSLVSFSPPENSQYVANQFEIDFPENNETVEEVFYLKKGVRVFGKATVAQSNQVIDSLRIRVADKDYIQTYTNSNGDYEFYVPEGEQSIKASKIGFISVEETREFNEDEIEINFELQDGGDKNISQLLGFDIELSQVEENTDGSQTWTGEFVNLDFYLPIIKLDNETNLKFTDIQVSFDQDGNAIPESGEVAINKSSLDAKLFNFIPLKFENKEQPQIIVKKDEVGNWGSISGQISLDPFRIITHETSREMLQSFAPTLLPDVVSQAMNESTPGSIEFFMGEGADRLPSLGSENENALEQWLTDQGVPIAEIENSMNDLKNYKNELKNLKFRFSDAYDGDVEMNVYDFELILDTENSWVSQQGINIAGQINTPQIGPLDPLELPVEDLSFDTEFELSNLEIEIDDLPALTFGDNFKAHLNQLQLSENGITTGGIVSLSLPSSAPSYLKLSDLKINTNGISGGQFSFSLDGLEEELKQKAKAAAQDTRDQIRDQIPVFGAAIIKDNGSNLSFGQMSQTGAYYLSGSVDMEFTKYIKQKVEINNFMLSTDGDFTLDVPTNYAADFGFAAYHLDAIEVRYIESLPALSLNGGFDANFNIISFEASDIVFKATESGDAEVEIESINASLDIPGINADVSLDVGANQNGDEGFSGEGGFEIPGTEFGTEIAFHYYKGPSRLDVGASFMANASIPLGGVVSLTSLGGGFKYEKNRNQYKATIEIKSGVEITGTGDLIKIDPLEVEVKTGNSTQPVINGHGSIEVANSINLVEADMTLDLNQKLFAISVNSELEPLNGVRGNATGLGRVSWKNDFYVFIGARAQFNIIDFANAHGVFAVGYNLKPSVRNSSDISPYFSNDHIDEATLGRTDNFNGVFVGAGTSIDTGRLGGDIWVASAHARFSSRTDAFFFLNFPTSHARDANFKVSLSGEMKGSAGVSILSFNVLDASAEACYRVTGGYNNTIGWNIDGRVAARIKVDVLKHPRKCNRIKYSEGSWLPPYPPFPIGARVCGYADISVAYKQKGANRGFDLGGSLGENSNSSVMNCN